MCVHVILTRKKKNLLVAAQTTSKNSYELYSSWGIKLIASLDDNREMFMLFKIFLIN